MKMGEEYTPAKGAFERTGVRPVYRNRADGLQRLGIEPITSAMDVLSEVGDWRSLLANYSKKISLQARDIFAVFVVISSDLHFRWTTHQERAGEGNQMKYEELLPLNADFGESIRPLKGPASGVALIDEISVSTGCNEFTLFRGAARGGATLYLYIGGRRTLSGEEERAFSSVTVIFDSIIKREFALGDQLAHSARLSAAIELGRQLGDSALAGSFLNRAADTIQKKMGVDYVAVLVMDEGREEVEFAGISESLTPLYDTPQSMRPAKMLRTVFSQKETLVISETETNGYRPLGTGVKWAALIPLDTHSKRKAALILESKSLSPYDEGELKDIEVVASLLSDRLATSISISEKERKVLLRNMLLEEMLLLHRESDPVKIAEESLSFVESVVSSTISVFYVLNDTRTTLIPVTSRGLFAQEMLSISIPVGEGIVGKAIANDKPELIEDAREDLRAINMPWAAAAPESILVIPIKSIKEDIGVITLHRSGRKGFSAEDMEVISMISRQLSAVMERANSSVEMRKVVAEKEAEASLSSLLADEFITALSEESADALPPRMLRRLVEISACDSGALFVREPAGGVLRCIAQRPSGVMPPRNELAVEDVDALMKESVHLANNGFIIEDGYRVEDACSRLGIKLDGEAQTTADGAHPYIVFYATEPPTGAGTVFVGVGYQQSKSRQLFRGQLLQKLMSFFELRYSRMHDRKIDSDELLKVKKVSYFKDVVYAETDLNRLFEKVTPAVGELVGASIVAVYQANYGSSSFDLVAQSTYNSSAEPPPKMVMSQVPKLVQSLENRRSVVAIGNEEGDIPFSSLLSLPLLGGKISSMDGTDYIVITAFEEKSETESMQTLLSDLLKALSMKVRQLTAINQERHRTGLLNLIDEIARNVIKQGEFSRMLDAIASAAGHLVGTEYALVGVKSSSNIEWSGYYETRIPEVVERLAVKSLEKGSDCIINNMDEIDAGGEGDVPGSISNIMIYPVTARDSKLPSVFILLINKLTGEGFNDADAWILERLSSNILGSIKTIEALKQETIMKKKAELKKVELAELLDGIEGGIMRLDNEGTVAFANTEARKMFGFKQDDTAPRLVDYLSDTDSLQVIDFMDSVKKGERFEGSYTFNTEAGLKRISISGRQIIDRGRRKGTLLFARDEGVVKKSEEAGIPAKVNEKHAEIRNIRFAMRRGFSYTVSEEKPSMAYATLTELTGAGFEALVISREHPSKLKEKYEMGTADIRWLTQVVGNNNLDPSKLSVITSAIISYLERHDNAVIFLDGLEYLLANNNTIRVIAMIENVMQKVVDCGAVVIAAINRLTFEQKDLAMISKMFEELDTTELKKRYLNRGIEEFGAAQDDSSNIDAND